MVNKRKEFDPRQISSWTEVVFVRSWKIILHYTSRVALVKHSKHLWHLSPQAPLADCIFKPFRGRLRTYGKFSRGGGIVLWKFHGRGGVWQLEIPRGRGKNVDFPGAFYLKIDFPGVFWQKHWKFPGRGSFMRLEIPGEGDLLREVLNPPLRFKMAISHKYSQTQKSELNFFYPNFNWVPLLPQTQKQVKFFWSHLENLFATIAL